ncbi:MAG: serine/threonine protein kinase [Ignavibacteriales bacterium]|nr:MAG: serine/threonine protein kinase [Ignavibacteriales bacterium]
MDPLIGQIIDNYKIIEVIGRGGMGVVFKAMDMNLEKIVALKMIDPFLARDSNFLNRFKTEAKALAKLENRNIVAVYALRETPVGLFMVMEYVHGLTVSEQMRESGKYSAKETIAITNQLLNAINHAHAVGVIHRDIKPNNILLCEDGTVKVMDFGLAKVAQEHSSQATATHAAAGTLYYMSPEQIKGLKNVDTRSDIYSIGMSVYEMLAGRVPFDKSESEYEIQKQIIEGKIPPPIRFNPLIPKQLNRFVMKAIDKDADKRYQTVSEMIKDLSSIVPEESSDEEKTRLVLDNTSIKQYTEEKSKKKNIYIWISSAAAVCIVVVSLFLLLNSEEVKPEPPKEKKQLQGSFETVPPNLFITSNPVGANVILNDENVGVTPFFRDSLKTETYKVSLSLAGYEKWSDANYTLKPGANTIDIRLKPIIERGSGVLLLKTENGGTITVNNKKQTVDNNGSVRVQVPTGTHNIEFSHPVYGSKKSTIKIDSDQSKELTCYFRQRINIQSLNKNGDAFWGTIYINNVNTGKTTPGDTLLGPGTYNITVKKAGYKTTETDQVVKISPSFEFRPRSMVFHLE